MASEEPKQNRNAADIAKLCGESILKVLIQGGSLMKIVSGKVWNRFSMK